MPVVQPSPRRLRTVALIGIDGSGKTTQARLLAAELSRSGLPATYHQNAGGRRWFGRLAERFGRDDAQDLLGRRLMLLVESVLRWLAIARALLRRVRSGDVAVMDRYAACQYASLRARGRGRAGERLARVAYSVFPRPDVTFLLAVRPEVAWQRVETRGYDHEDLGDLRAADAAYRDLPEHAHVVVVDANGTLDEVAAAIRGHLAAYLPAAQPLPRQRPAVSGVLAAPALADYASAVTPLAQAAA
ncbi:thymidylate kinase [Spirilliplanes yamanashiensis]|uniref:Thymidylate kinase n=1 Tax=Spirilliplanes yamanashiensis TaxID=42233 RepID=A0A8J4DLY1_9ACTN|nr:thymidylate kinase [Spirilliplanes yamanashiensis]